MRAAALGVLGFCFCVGPAAAADTDKGFLGLPAAWPTLADESGDFAFSIHALLDLEYYRVDDTAPGLIRPHHPFLNPRLSWFVDFAIGDRLTLFFQAREDRGFDPNNSGRQIRLDEAFARWTEGGDAWGASLQAGKFATPIGNFVPRHDAMKNPLVRAPMVYDHITTIGDAKAPAGNPAQIGRRDLDDKRADWLTMIWGPVYHTGAMVFGNAGPVDLRLALTNAAPAERPYEWGPKTDDAGNLAWSGRVGVNPFLGFKAGLNYAAGPYLRSRAAPTLPAGRHRDDYPQRLAGVDLEYSVGHLELFSEVYWSEWEAPHISGDLRSLGYYVEAKYALFPGFFAAARWNQMTFGAIRDAAGEQTPWDRNAWRAELGVGYFIHVNLLAKAQYELNHTNGPNDPRDDMASFSLSVSF